MTSSTRTERLPLLHDNHTHTSLYASLGTCPDIASLSAQQALARLERLPEDVLTVVRGWKPGTQPLSESDLQRLPPALIVNVSLHGFMLTDAALAMAEKVMPEIRFKRHDASWAEANLPRLFALSGSLAGMDSIKLEAFLESLRPLGFGSAEDMTITCRKAFDVVCRGPSATRVPLWVTPGVIPELPENAQKAVCGVKLFLDGSLGARTAALSSGTRGPWTPVLTYSDDALRDTMTSNARFGAFALHAIGDRAVDQALRITKEMRADGFVGRVRLEHVQFIDRDQARRARDLGAILSMQPNFSTDSVDYADRLTDELRAANGPYRMLIDEVGFRPGIDLVFGSDGMPHGIVHAAQAALFPYAPGQHLTLEELASGYGKARGTTGEFEILIDDRSGTVSVHNFT